MPAAEPRTLAVHLQTERNAEGFHLDVAFTAPPGVTVLFGPSGAGKSTVLAAIAGLIRPPAGRITLGSDVWFDAGAAVHRAVHTRAVAYVFQSLALFPHMTALANVEYGVARELAPVERKGRALAMLERMKVAHLSARRPRTFSGGEAQRVALARAFAMNPSVVLLDEAFSAMDRELRRELAFDVRRFVEETHIPTILVTHMRNEARALGDRVVMMKQGRVVAVGGVEELLGVPGSGAAAGPRDRAYDDPDLTPAPR